MKITIAIEISSDDTRVKATIGGEYASTVILRELGVDYENSWKWENVGVEVENGLVTLEDGYIDYKLGNGQINRFEWDKIEGLATGEEIKDAVANRYRNAIADIKAFKKEQLFIYQTSTVIL